MVRPFFQESAFSGGIYWPTLKETMQGIIDHGFVPVPFVEGTFDRRLDTMAADPLPKSRSMWIFDRAHMKAAKEKIGGRAGFNGVGAGGEEKPACSFSVGMKFFLDLY